MKRFINWLSNDYALHIPIILCIVFGTISLMFRVYDLYCYYLS